MLLCRLAYVINNHLDLTLNILVAKRSFVAPNIGKSGKFYFPPLIKSAT